MSHANGYGAIRDWERQNTDDGADEEQPLLLGRKHPSRMTVICEKLTVDVKRDWADVVLILCYLITGLLDSASISIWGSFVSMQTGVCSYEEPTGSVPTCPFLHLLCGTNFLFYSLSYR